MDRFERLTGQPKAIKGIIITGTDTGVGKTVAAAALARLLRDKGVNVGVMKPVTSGCDSRDGQLFSADAELLAFGAGIEVSQEVAPYLLKEPIAPSAAAEMERVRVEFSRILAAYHRLADQHDFIIVEGAGGLMVPLSGGLLVADLVKLLGLPLLVVARPGLGTVNHTVLTTFVARQLELDVRGVLINGYPEAPSLAESTAPHLIDSLSGVPLLGRLPRIDAKDEQETVVALAAWLGKQPATRILLREIGCE
ncbi:MAG: dethiobiotin synthase [Geobacter sp.]|nr:dethiobiotin synthase [Geobacter sp.]